MEEVTKKRAGRPVGSVNKPKDAKKATKSAAKSTGKTASKTVKATKKASAEPVVANSKYYSASKENSRKGFSSTTYMKWYEMMLRIRRFEERASQMYSEKKIRGFFHVYIGQEAIAAGMMSACRHEDAWITAYRQHGTAIAKGVPTDEAMAELYGKITGNVKGKGGSMHFFSKKDNYYGGHGIVGGQIGLGAGLAFAEQYKGTDNVCLTLFGDGAARQGILHESFNMAMTWKLPVIFICENNRYAMGTSVERTSNVTDIVKFGAAYDMPAAKVDGMSPEAVHDALQKAIERARKGGGPTLLEIETYRYRGHSVSDPGKYRSKEEVQEYKEKDPISITRAKILAQGFGTEEQLQAIEAAIEVEIDAAIDFAEKSPFPTADELYTDNYVDQDYEFLT